LNKWKNKHFTNGAQCGVGLHFSIFAENSINYEWRPMRDYARPV